MTSPFPGMDPYLELHWLDVHSSLVYNARNAIQRQLTGELRARIGERLIVEEDWEAKRAILPDIQIYESGLRGGPAVLEAPAGVAIAEPLVMRFPRLERRETFVKIIDPASGGRVITLIEFVSPTNKLSKEGRRLYCAKRDEAIEAQISFVEIDLTRAGAPVFRISREALPAEKQATYLASIWRGGTDDDHYEVYPIRLRERLPVILIPLRAEDRDAVLDLQELIERAYDDGRYDDLDYQRPLDPRLPEDDEAWAAQLLAKRTA